MKKTLAALLAVLLCTASPASAWYHTVVPMTTVSKSGAAVVFGGSASTGAAIVGGGIAGVGAACIWCAANEPKRNKKKDTWVDTRHDVSPKKSPYPYDGCLFKTKKQKSDPAPKKLWPFGK